MEVTQDKQDDKTVKIDITRTNVEDSVSIVIVNKDKPEYLNICLQSIAVNRHQSAGALSRTARNTGKVLGSTRSPSISRINA